MDKRVLVADGDLKNLSIVQWALDEAGFQVFAAATGGACLECLAPLVPDLALLDVDLPGLSGFDICRRMRLRVDLSTVPVCFMAQHGDDNDLVRCLQAGGNDYIRKPLDRRRLLERVSFWTAQRPKIQERHESSPTQVWAR